MDFDRNLVEKYLNGTASGKEAKQVLTWFKTKEGEEYLSTRFHKDWEDAEKFAVDSPKASRTLEKIHSRIAAPTIPKHHIPVRRRTSFWAVAASVAFLVASFSFMYVFYGDGLAPEETVASMVYATGPEEHQIITLRDGTRIRLNENSTLHIPEAPDPQARTVQLEGEAFFEVVSDSLRPFLVEACEAEIRVLGTEFNIKTTSRSNNLIVAVTEGRVSLGSRADVPEQHTILEKNMVGLLNLETHEVIKEQTEGLNYASWMHGRVVFERTPFAQVVRQLSHIYDVESTILDNELFDLRLTADFSERSLDNVLETIAWSLGIEVDRDGDALKWTNSK